MFGMYNRNVILIIHTCKLLKFIILLCISRPWDGMVWWTTIMSLIQKAKVCANLYYLRKSERGTCRSSVLTTITLNRLSKRGRS